jgi:hypothetical protein
MKTTNSIQVFHFQLVKIIVAHHLCLFLSEKRRKKGAHTFIWNLLELPDRWKEVKY